MRRTLIDPPFIRVWIRGRFRVGGGRIVIYRLPFEVIGDAREPDQVDGAIQDTIVTLTRYGWECGDDGHGELEAVLDASAELSPL